MTGRTVQTINILPLPFLFKNLQLVTSKALQFEYVKCKIVIYSRAVLKALLDEYQIPDKPSL